MVACNEDKFPATRFSRIIAPIHTVTHPCDRMHSPAQYRPLVASFARFPGRRWGRWLCSRHFPLPDPGLACHSGRWLRSRRFFNAKPIRMGPITREDHCMTHRSISCETKIISDGFIDCTQTRIGGTMKPRASLVALATKRYIMQCPSGPDRPQFLVNRIANDLILIRRCRDANDSVFFSEFGIRIRRRTEAVLGPGPRPTTSTDGLVCRQAEARIDPSGRGSRGGIRRGVSKDFPRPAVTSRRRPLILCSGPMIVFHDPESEP